MKTKYEYQEYKVTAEQVIDHAKLCQEMIIKNKETNSLNDYLSIDLLDTNYRKRAILEDLDLSSKCLDAIDLSDAIIKNTNFSNSNIINSKFAYAKIGEKTNFYKSSMNLADFKNSSLKDCDFSGAILHSALFDESTLEKVNLSKTDLRVSQFCSSKLSCVSLIGSYFGGVAPSTVFENIIAINTKYNEKYEIDKSSFIDSLEELSNRIKANDNNDLNSFVKELIQNKEDKRNNKNEKVEKAKSHFQTKVKEYKPGNNKKFWAELSDNKEKMGLQL